MRLLRKGLVTAVLLGMLFVSAGPVSAGIPIGIPATEMTQLLNYAQLLASKITQAEQLAYNTKAYIEQVRNGVALPFQQWSSVMSDIGQIAQIVQVGKSLAFSLGSLDANFRNTFTGYSSPGTPFYKQYQNWSQTSLDTTQSTLKAAGIGWKQLESEKGLMSYLQSKSQSANGQMQALEVSNQVAVEQVGQFQKLRELMLADMQSKQAYQAYEVQKDMHEQQVNNNFFAPKKAGRDGISF